jgi:hypothetical protein
MPTSITSYYVLPAIILNPVVILHGINTILAHLLPPTLSTSTSCRPWLEQFGPSADTSPYLDVHANEQLCWSYTLVMVGVQILAFGRVGDNRVKRKSAKAAKDEEKLKETQRFSSSRGVHKSNGTVAVMDGACGEEIAFGIKALSESDAAFESDDMSLPDSESSIAETSEEETIV